MRRIVMALGAVALLAVVSATAAFAQTPTSPENQWGVGWSCPGWAGAPGSYDYSANPTVQRLAETIGIDAAGLVAELQAGRSVVEVAQANGVGEDALVETLIAPRRAMLQVRLDYGYLTQEQADQMLSFMTERVREQLSTPGFFAGYGRGGMMGPGFGPGGCGGPAEGGASFGPRRGGPGMMGGGYGPGMMGRGFGPRF